MQVCRELRYNVLYRYFCGIRWDDPVPDDTTLVTFRKRLGKERFKWIFDRLVREAKDQGLLKGNWALVDGSKMVAHAAIKNKVKLVREGKRRIVSALRKYDEEAARTVEGLAEAEREGDYANYERLLAGEVAGAREPVEKVSGRKEKELRQLVQTFRDLLDDKGVAGFTDPDARWGFQKKNDPFLGYKVHAAVDEAGFVTEAAVTSLGRQGSWCKASSKRA